MIDFHDKFLYDAVINMDRDKWEIVCVGELVPDCLAGKILYV